MLNPAQQELKPLLGAVRTKPVLADWSLVAKCRDGQDAILLCVHLSRLANEEIAFQLSIDKGHWTRIMQGRGNLPERKRTQLMSICGNLAPVQYDSLKFGMKLVEDDLDAKEQALLAQLAQVQQAKSVRMAA